MIPDWLTEAYTCGPDEKPKRGDLGPMFKWVFERQARGEHDQTDQMIREADFTRLAPVFLIGILRSNFTASAWLPSWKPAVARVRDELLRRGEPLEQVKLELTGLIEDDMEPTRKDLKEEIKGSYAMTPIRPPPGEEPLHVRPPWGQHW